MECKACGTVNKDDAIFCKQCGVRLDGKKICKSCGAENDLDAKFCNKCGVLITDDVTTAKKVVDTNQEISSDDAKQSNWKRILGFVGWGLAMTGLFFSVLFTFFIGIGLNNSDVAGNTPLNLSYFLVDAYKNLKSLPSSISPEWIATNYMPIFFGTLVIVALLVTVSILAAVSIVRFVKYARGKSNCDFAKPTIAAYLVFLMGSVMLLGLFSISLQYYSSSSETVTTTRILNSATTTGIVMGGLCMVAFVGLRVAVKGKQIASRENILKVVFGGIALVVSGVLLGVLPKGAVAIRYTSYATSENRSGSFFTMLSMLSYSNAEVTDKLIVATFAQMIQLVLIILVVVNLLNQMMNTIDRKTKSTLGLAITTLIFATIYVFFTVVFDVMLFEGSTSGIEFVYSTPIVIWLFAALNLAAAITQKVMCKKTQSAESQI